MSAKIRADFENPNYKKFEEKLSRRVKVKKEKKINFNIGSSDDVLTESSSSSSSDEDDNYKQK